MRSTWSAEKIREFRDWHDGRLAELNYPAALVKELTDARERWLPAQTPVVQIESGSFQYGLGVEAFVRTYLDRMKEG